MKTDTIAAIATGMSNSGIGIVRISGDDALQVISRIYRNKKGEPKNLSQVKSHTIHYGYIYDGEERLDEVLVMIMKGPNSYTAEDTVEIDCHGGVFIVKKILETVIRNGARTAEPGEFTKRAFLNGRIDLSQAEAISDIITAKNSYASSLALKGIQGSISHFIKDLKEDLIQIITQIEVNIDYPEYEDVEELTADKLLPMSTSLIERMNKIIEDSKNIKLLKDGIQTAIIGKPNVGKSSLLNAMLKEEKAIVTNIAGTTRDVVEGSVTVDGILLNMIDTAGIRETDNIVESLGVEKSKEMIKKADLVLLVIDGSKELDQEDQKLLELTEDTNRIVIINKADLGKKVDLKYQQKNKIF